VALAALAALEVPVAWAALVALEEEVVAAVAVAEEVVAEEVVARLPQLQYWERAPSATLFRRSQTDRLYTKE
jgi:hypothetical protein